MNSIQKLQDSVGASIDNFKNTSSDTFFLSHFHADHYNGISAKMFQSSNKYIYCSELTATLLIKAFKIPSSSVKSLTLGTQHQIMVKKRKIFVTLFNANHCPGSVLFLFENFETKEKILYTGDFRFEDYTLEDLVVNQMIQEVYKIDKLFIDTTFCEEFYEDLPTRNDSIEQVCKLIDGHKGKVYISMEVLGSECLILALYHKYNIKFYIDTENVRISP